MVARGEVLVTRGSKFVSDISLRSYGVEIANRIHCLSLIWTYSFGFILPELSCFCISRDCCQPLSFSKSPISKEFGMFYFDSGTHPTPACSSTGPISFTQSNITCHQSLQHLPYLPSSSAVLIQTHSIHHRNITPRITSAFKSQSASILTFSYRAFCALHSLTSPHLIQYFSPHLCLVPT
jgi:hypothetical protein